MSEILTDTTQTSLWHDLVRDAEQRASLRVDDELESYLVFLLMRHLRDGEINRRVMALDMLDALALSGRDREQSLRETGDRCLLIAGLYPEQAQRRLVSLDYFLALGAHAYAELAGETRAALAKLYQRLAQRFARLVRILVELRSYSREWSPDAMTRYALARNGGATDRDFVGSVLLGETSSRH